MNHQPPAVEDLTRILTNLLPEYLADLKTLVDMDSGSDDKPGLDAVCSRLDDLFRREGMETERYPAVIEGDHLLGSMPGKGNGKVMLLGHMDTVFPRGTAAERPLRIENGRALGPGVCDMKGGVLLGLYALKALRVCAWEDFAEIRFLIVSDEETNQRSSIPLIQQHARAAKAVLCLEPGRPGGEVVSSRKGIRWFNVEAHGKAAHAGVEPEKGASAILALARMIPELHALNHAVGEATLNAGVIEGGRAPNVVPEYARVHLDVRAFSERDLDAMEARIRSLCDEEFVPGVTQHCNPDDGAAMPAMERTPQVMLLEEMAIRLGKESGLEIRGVGTGGGSDASFAAAEGTPALDGLGPVGGKAHSSEEYLEIESVVPRAVLLARMIAEIAGNPALLS